MIQYRIYCLNEEGRFQKVKEIEASSDAEALAHARSLEHSAECEVWTKSRFVGRVAPAHPVTTSSR